jgi:hypothetical protein
MAKVWKITAYEEQMGGGPPRKHYYLVAMSDQSAALSALRKRPGLRDVELTVVGEASPNDVEWLDAKDGEIFVVMPIFETRFSK